jgi:hypothetical protein
MTVLSYSRRLVKRQEVQKQRRSFALPKAWVFSNDKDFFYLKFDEKKARRFYKPKRFKEVKVKW